MFSGPWVWKKPEKGKENVKKIEIARFVKKKMLEVVTLKCRIPFHYH